MAAAALEAGKAKQVKEDLAEERPREVKEGSSHRRHSPSWFSPRPPMARPLYRPTASPTKGPTCPLHPPTARPPCTERSLTTQVTTKRPLMSRRTLLTCPPCDPAQHSTSTYTLFTGQRESSIFLSCPQLCEASTGSLFSPGTPVCMPSAACLGLSPTGPRKQC